MSSREKADTAEVDCHEIYSDFPVEETEEEKRILDQMTGEQMAVLVCGTPASGSFQSDIGTAAATVPGAAGETTSDYIGAPGIWSTWFWRMDRLPARRELITINIVPEYLPGRCWPRPSTWI